MEDFVSFELANKLKEKGFNEGCYKYYEGKKLKWSNSPWLKPRYNDYLSHITAAPTISQVLEWLRKKKKISIEPGIHCSLKWMCSIYGFGDGIEDFTQYDNDGVWDTIYILYDTYEQAVLAGIEYSLDNLI